MSRLHPSTLSATPGAAPEPAAVRRDASALVLRVVDEGADADSFLGRRARAAVAQLGSDGDRRPLQRLLDAAPETDGLVDALIVWAGHLEGAGRIHEAVRAMDLVLSLAPENPSAVLHAARLARKADDRLRARRLYDRVASLDTGDGRLGRLARVGRALVSDHPEEALTASLRLARQAGDAEATAVAQEARAGIRRERGDVVGAVRDYLISAVRYQDPLDVGRIGHEMADLLLAAGELSAARVVLLETLGRAERRQALWARSRLLVLSRALGDELGARRWADAPTPPFTSLMPRTSAPAGDPAGRARSVGRWIQRVAARFPPPTEDAGS